jgi:hypothetical protein
MQEYRTSPKVRFCVTRARTGYEFLVGLNVVICIRATHNNEVITVGLNESVGLFLWRGGPHLHVLSRFLSRTCSTMLLPFRFINPISKRMLPHSTSIASQRLAVTQRHLSSSSTTRTHEPNMVHRKVENLTVFGAGLMGMTYAPSITSFESNCKL